MKLATMRYGRAEAQAYDLYLPSVTRHGLVCLLHGGFWRAPHGRNQMDAVAADLAARGYVVCNMGYRRVGEAGGGWPGTFDDVIACFEHLMHTVNPDSGPVVLAGHSAGGQLALWLASTLTYRRMALNGVAGLAPVTDLEALGGDDSPAAALLGASWSTAMDRYARYAPLSLLPIGVPQLILHGEEDEVLSAATSQRYAETARAAGDVVTFTSLRKAGHMDFLDPQSEAHAQLCAWLETKAQKKPTPILDVGFF